MYLPLLILMHVLILAVQLLLCFKAKRLVWKILPVGAFALAAAVCGVMCMIITGWDVFSWLIFLIFSLIMLGVCGLAWAIWAIVYFMKRRRAAK